MDRHLGLRMAWAVGGLVLLMGGTLLAQSDTQPPEITIEVPADRATFALNEPVTVDWTVRDPEPSSGLAVVRASQERGEPLATDEPGRQFFRIIARDNAGNETRKQVRYRVVYPTVAMQQPLGAEAFAGEEPPELRVSAGVEVPFAVAVRDHFDEPVPEAIGTLSVLDADTREIVFPDEEGIGVFAYDADSRLHRTTLATENLEPGRYLGLVQFDDGRSLRRLELTLEAPGS